MEFLLSSSANQNIGTTVKHCSHRPANQNVGTTVKPYSHRPANQNVGTTVKPYSHRPDEGNEQLTDSQGFKILRIQHKKKRCSTLFNDFDISMVFKIMVFRKPKFNKTKYQKSSVQREIQNF